MQRVTILGSTGSIGTSTLDVIATNSDLYKVYALVANKNIELFYAQIKQFQPTYAVMADEVCAEKLRSQLANDNVETHILSGEQAIVDVAKHNDADIVMSAIVGAAGLLPTLAAIKSGKKILLANKEALVMSGAYFMEQAKLAGATLLPVDSEHNAIFQCLSEREGKQYQGVEKITLTASGGPFIETRIHDLHAVTPEQACAHPNWNMGKKISVDSATMMNKGLEIIEAHWLFNMPHEQIDVLVHPESIIHSMVSYHDGSVLAQLGNPDMRTPIAHALAWPARINTNVKGLDLSEIATLHFEKPDLQRFPCLQIAYNAIQLGGSATIALNAANEIAVEAFLNVQIKFTDIPLIISAAMEQMSDMPVTSLEQIIYADQETRRLTQNHINQEYA